MDTVNDELIWVLRNSGADLIGFADLGGLVTDGLTSGVAVGVTVPRRIVSQIPEGPTMEYFDAYHELNSRLDGIVVSAARFLESLGYRAFAQTTTAVDEDADYRTRMPHKTVAVRSGLGWIGKNALLVTEEYGSALRISSLLTDAPLESGLPVTEPHCSGCTECVDACPAGAVKGALWQPGLEREALVDVFACRAAARELSWNLLGKEITLCGRCIAACPYTRRYLSGTLEKEPVAY